MVVFIFEVDKKFRDAEKLTNELIKRGAVPKCKEQEELKEPSWRETINFVHIRTEGSWRIFPKASDNGILITKEPLNTKLIDFEVDELGKPKPVEHMHRYFNPTSGLVLTEETKMKAIIEHRAEDLIPELPHMSFGNGVTVVETMPRVYVAYVVFDHSKRKLADEVVEQIRL